MGRLTFHEDSHTFCLDDTIVPSVTKIINAVVTPPQGEGGSVFGGPYYMERGSMLHREIAERFDSDDAVDSIIAEPIEAFRRFRDLLGLVPIVQEAHVHSEILRCAGILDCIAMDNNNALWILDWKTGGAGPKDRVQVAAYHYMARELTMRGEPGWNGMTARDLVTATAAVIPLGSRNPRPLIAQEADEAAFKAAAVLYHWKSANNALGKGEQ